MTKLHVGRRTTWAVAAVLAATPLRSALAKRQARPPSPPGPGGATNPFIWARNENEFRQALQDGAAQGFVPMFDPRTDIEQSSTIVIEQQKNQGTTWGANGNHAKIRWVGPGGQDMIVIQGVNGVANRGFYFEKFNMYGGGYDRAPCGACLKLRPPLGDVGALYKFTLRDIYTSWGTYGIVLQGAVFEGMCENVHGENHTKDGMHMEHTNVGQSNPGIVSNVQLIHPNMSRNLGAGVRSVYSCNAAFGSFVLNGEAGIVAPEGLRLGFANNGENTGEAVYAVPNNGYGSYILYSEGSTDGSTHARRFDGTRKDWAAWASRCCTSSLEVQASPRPAITSRPTVERSAAVACGSSSKRRFEDRLASLPRLQIRSLRAKEAPPRSAPSCSGSTRAAVPPSARRRRRDRRPGLQAYRVRTPSQVARCWPRKTPPLRLRSIRHRLAD